MRADMDEVIIERPRRGSGWRVPRKFNRFDLKRVDPAEDTRRTLPVKLGHQRMAGLSGDRKTLNENLSPLRRFLHSQVGRPWDKVWSEISANLRPSSIVQQHVRDHIADFVAVKTIVRDGIVLVAGGRWDRSPTPLAHVPRKLYVDPRTGILRLNKAAQSYGTWRRAKMAAELRDRLTRMWVIGPLRELHRLDDGNWWEIELAPIETVVERTMPPRHARADTLKRELPFTDVVDRAGLCTIPRSERYQRATVYAVEKRPLKIRLKLA